MPIPLNKLKTALLEADLISSDAFDVIAAEAGKRKASIDTVLVERNVIPDEYIGQIVSEVFGVPFAKLEKHKISDHVLRIIPERVARRSHIIAFDANESEVKVALRDPDDLELVRLIEKKSGRKALVHFATEKDLLQAVEKYSSDLGSAIKELVDASGYLSRRAEGSEDADMGEDETVVTAVQLVLNYAYQHGASDVHIEPREQEVLVRYRIDGILHDVVSLPHILLEPIVTRIKVLARLRTDEHFASQDGKLQEIIDGERVDVRVSVLPVVDGEKVVMRLLTEKGKRHNLEDLGFSEADMKKLKRYMQKSFGMILATGPTGSGKTTSMYSVLKLLNTRDVNIATIEDPIEYAIEGVNQIQVNVKAGLTFANGLRSIVRQDPDIVMVGEIRDEETAAIAVNAAMTGHLVLSTLHTNDAATTLPRFRDMHVEPFLIASTVNVIIAQRLVRRICSRCIISYDAEAKDLQGTIPDDVIAKLHLVTSKKVPTRLFKGKGCDRCEQTGYLGRLGIFEVLEVDDSIRELIMQNANAGDISKKAVANGMTTMFQDGMQKVLAGLTTIDEIVRVTGG